MQFEIVGDKQVPKGSMRRWEMYWESTRGMQTAMRCLPKDRRRTVVQAGGNIGAFPLWLSARFKKVYTFEPEPTNYACLVANTVNCPNVEPYHAGLGDVEGYFDLEFVAKGIGSHYMTNRPGPYRVMTIDRLQPKDVDFLMLDIEGYEYPALEGALKTIEKYQPIIQIEDKGNGQLKGRGHTLSDILKLLPGYKEYARAGNWDVVLVPENWKSHR